MLDRTKEPGALGEPLYLDVVTALAEAQAAGDASEMPRVIGGRYGLSSKEFTPAMVDGGLRRAGASPSRGQLHGRHQRRRDRHQPRLRPDFSTRADETVRAVFFGLGARRHGRRQQEHDQDHRRGHDRYAQGYFVYDSKKSGSQTVSSLSAVDAAKPRPMTAIAIPSSVERPLKLMAMGKNRRPLPAC